MAQRSLKTALRRYGKSLEEVEDDRRAGQGQVLGDDRRDLTTETLQTLPPLRYTSGMFKRNAGSHSSHETSRGRCWIDGILGPARNRLLAFGLLALSALSSCDRPPDVRVVSAVFRDDRDANGRVDPDETIVLHLANPLPESRRISDLRVTASPATPTAWSVRGDLSADRKRITLHITGQPNFLIPGQGSDSTQLIVDLGDQIQQTIDLQPARSIAKLDRVIWDDASPDGGNGAVDEGDLLHLRFSEPVTIPEEMEGREIRVPRDVALSKANLDRLDDGSAKSTLRSGRSPNEVTIQLGSNPVLNVSGTLPDRLTQLDRSRSDAPSGLVVRGTELSPLNMIRSQRSGFGVASTREIDIDFPADYPKVVAHRHQKLPDPGARSLHTVTPFTEYWAVIAGGRSVTGGELLDQIVVFDTTFVSGPAFTAALEQSLPRPSIRHTATRLRGRDELGPGGLPSDYVVIAGGYDGRDALDHLTVVRSDPVRSFVVEPIETRLAIPRFAHAATMIDSNTLLIDGGVSIDSTGRELLVGCSERIVFERREEELDDGSIRTSLVVKDHQVFRSLPRRNHSLSLLESGDSRWALAYGGYGLKVNAIQDQEIDSQLETCLFTQTGALVLDSPILMNTANPKVAVRLQIDRSVLPFPFFRHHHDAIIIPDDGQPRGSGRSALIVGGTVEHPRHGYGRTVRPVELSQLWDISQAEIARVFRRNLASALPRAEDSMSCVLITLDPNAPENSRVELITRPGELREVADQSTGDARIDASANLVPGLGIIITGGGSGDSPLTTVDLFQPDTRRLSPFALRLGAPRTRHRSVLAQRENQWVLFLVGGETSREDTESLSDLEEIPLPLRSR